MRNFVEIKASEKKGCSKFKLITKQKTFDLKANNIGDRDEWIKALKGENNTEEVRLSVFEDFTQECLFDDLYRIKFEEKNIMFAAEKLR